MIKNDVYYCVVKKVHERKTGARMEDSYGAKKMVERSGSLPDLSA